MTPLEKLSAALAALDHARRTIEVLVATDTGDREVDAAVDDISETLEAEIVALHALQAECVS